MQFRRYSVILAGLMLMMSVGQSIRSVQAHHDEEPAKFYVGQLADSADVFVALAIDEDQATLYLCDGQPDKASVAFGEWYSGPVVDDTIDITSASGNRVQVALTDLTADGQFTFKDKTVKKFSLKVDPEAQLLRSEFTIDGEKYLAGWIILADGTSRGSLKKESTGALSPASISAIPVAHDSKKEG